MSFLPGYHILFRHYPERPIAAKRHLSAPWPPGRPFKQYLMRSRFLVRYIWRPLEKLGIPDPTSAAKNNRRKKKSEERLSKWAKDHRHILVTGHTHHPMTGDSASPYFNTGSCIHPAGITGIEIQSRSLTLVKWSTQAREDLTLQVTREILGGPICVDEIY